MSNSGITGGFLSLLTSFFLSFVIFHVQAGEVGWFQEADSVLVIKKGVKNIPAYSFRDRKDIAEVRFESPSMVTSIGDYAFIGCENIRKIELPESLRTLGEGTFRECVGLESIAIPSKVKKLPKFLFYWCEGLREVKLPSALTVIERGCFGFCRSLESVSFPAGIKNIGMNAFSCCESLTEIVLPASLTELESYAFSDCRNLKRITFPKNSSLLGELILSGCDNLESISELSAVPPKFDCNSFIFEPDEEGRYSEVILYVSPGKVSAYRNAPGWKLFQIIK